MDLFSDELESSMISEHVVIDFSSEERVSPEASLRHPPVQGFYFGISYSEMCKYGHTTLLEYEGKKHVAHGETWADESPGAASYWYTHRCHCRPLETRDTGLPLLTFNISLLFITVDDVLLRNVASAALLTHENAHIQTCTHVYWLVYLFVFSNPEVLGGGVKGELLLDPQLFNVWIFYGSVTLWYYHATLFVCFSSSGVFFFGNQTVW